MATMKEWENKASQLLDDDLILIADALETLNRWNFFKSEFTGLGLNALATVLKWEGVKRGLGGSNDPESGTMNKIEDVGMTSCEYFFLMKRNGQTFKVDSAKSASLFKHKLKRIKKHFKDMIDAGWELDIQANKTVETRYAAHNVTRPGFVVEPFDI